MRVLRAADYRVMPWKNGGGSTTEIAVSPAGASMEDFDWRVSMAHVGEDGPFSSFPGTDRTLSVLSGRGITLAFADGERQTLDVTSAPYAFAADQAVNGLLTEGPIDDLNVMTRRGRWSHRVARHLGTTARHVTVSDGLLVLVARSGDWRVGETVLKSGDSGLFDAPGRVTLAGPTGAAELYAITLVPLNAPRPPARPRPGSPRPAAPSARRTPARS